MMIAICTVFLLIGLVCGLIGIQLFIIRAENILSQARRKRAQRVPKIIMVLSAIIILAAIIMLIFS